MNGLMTDELFANSTELQNWCTVMSRCTASQVIDIDPVLSRFDPATTPMRGKAVLPDTTAIPPRQETSIQRQTVAVLIDAQPDKGPALAARLAAFAIEKNCDVVIVTSEDICGFEAYGFRTERVTSNEDDILIAQLKSLWGIEIVF
ncbi:hypothetical protein [Roseibium sp.]|uniref:hypothetical protein n=1 Tax=Roseibium sp. TaxID=1936156 RepID=UPI003D0AC48A